MNYIPNLMDINFSVPAQPLKIFKGWKEKTSITAHAACFIHKSGLIVFSSVDDLQDGEGNESKWVHLSCSRKDRLPTWDDLKGVKKMFLGDEKEALQVFPKTEDYVNLHPFCLHLWAQEQE
ncbi:hypothetical protein [Maridesulfovibrio ferrireducens]|uniref:DUF7694 domain-containing protein n=1 Tax=Maridesulfovibrio ferrireducens TaxID=246191 RepID=UPI001A2DB4D0|nr:hypothetical protein [Maridesulfovibrio ferrireducens]MBI9112426.1 hypothetical protein [Maridesulfovibrio ferrireducens]